MLGNVDFALVCVYAPTLTWGHKLMTGRLTSQRDEGLSFCGWGAPGSVEVDGWMEPSSLCFHL